MNLTTKDMNKLRFQKTPLPRLTGRRWGAGLLLLCCALLAACGSSDDDAGGQKSGDYTVATVSTPPSWEIDWRADQPRPDWQEPDIRNYESWSIVKILIEDALKPYTGSNDQMALFVGSECRGMGSPAIILDSDEKNTTTYLFKVWYNKSDGPQQTVTLKYYSVLLKQEFTFSTVVTDDVDEDVGVGSDFIPPFTRGSSKFPVVTTFNAAALLGKASILPKDGDVLAAFVGDECRGSLLLGSAGSPAGELPTLTVFGRTEGESVTVKYYQPATSQVFTFPDAAMTKK